MFRKKSKVKLTKEQRTLLHKKKIRRRVALLVFELILLIGLGATAYTMSKFEKLDFKVIDEAKLEIYQDTGEFTNIALFGLDSREGELDGGVNSDSIMIASINNNTKDVKIISVFRDTITQQVDGSYNKANSAYTFGGPRDAIALLNRNFDLDIQKYISVNFNALVDTIDLLGGIELDLTPTEVHWTNGYSTETSKVVGKTTTELTAPGVQTVDGIQAVSYTRIRYGGGDDFKRTERQRTVLAKVVEKSRSVSLSTLNKIVNKVLPQVSTNLSPGDFLGLAASAAKYKVAAMSGFPFDVTTIDNVKGMQGSYVTAISFADNVKQLHKYLFGVDNYTVSEKVQSIGTDVAYLTDVNGDNYERGLVETPTTPQDGGTSETQRQDGGGVEVQPQEGGGVETQPQEGDGAEVQPQEGGGVEAQPQEGGAGDSQPQGEGTAGGQGSTLDYSGNDVSMQEY